MVGRRMLDTNIIVAVFRGKRLVVDRFDSNEVFAISSIVFGELFYGALNSDRMKEELNRIHDLKARSKFLTCGSETSWKYAGIKTNLRQRGCMIPENDVWIAAQALEHDLTLITSDSHFESVLGLIEKW